jgi:NAD(P)-dependent dehydrogenase (short-subunit alcohol dehydrogenase family)
MTEHFKDKVVIVTGGASGIGRALCQELAGRGAMVVIADINMEGAQQVASGITSTGGQGRAVHLDVSKAENTEKLIDETVSGHGRLDYMFNNAGIGIAGEVRDMNLEHWRSILNVNLWGVICGTTSAYQVMIKQGFGHIVNIASLAGLVPIPMVTAYATTKYGVVGLSTSLRAEAAGLGVKVSVVCPGLLQTGICHAATVLNVRREDVLARAPFKMGNTTWAARAILRGVSRNKAVITMPFYVRLFWWLYRFHPALLSPWSHKMVQDFRALRRSSASDRAP